MDQGDPFLDVQKEVEAQLEQADSLVQSYRRIKQTSANPAQSVELESTRNDIESIVGDTRQGISDLEDAIAAVQHDPTQFALSNEIVESRKRHVESLKSKLESILSALGQTPSLQNNNNTSLPADDVKEEDNNNNDTAAYAEYERQQQQMLFEQQDRDLESVYTTVTNLRGQAHTIGNELEDQTELVEDLDRNVDTSLGKLKRGMKRVNYILEKNKDNASNCTILVLVVILVILIILLLG